MLNQHTYQNSISLNFSEMWRQGRVPVRSIRVIDIKELALMYDLEDYLIRVDIPLRLERDVSLFLATKSKKDIFHLALTMIVRKRGISSKDRFFDDDCLVSVEELKRLTISGSSKKTNPLDSLYDLLTFSYRRCKTLFKELNTIENNKDYFSYLMKVFEATYDMIVDNKNNFVGNLHVKALLTTLMNQKSALAIRHYMKMH